MKKSTALLMSILLSAVFVLFLVFSFFPVPEGVTVRPSVPETVSDARIDLNLADAEELQQIPGNGPVLSEAIVGWREEHGMFCSTDDLLLVPGIGEKTLNSMRDYITLGGSNENSGRG